MICAGWGSTGMRVQILAGHTPRTPKPNGWLSTRRYSSHFDAAGESIRVHALGPTSPRRPARRISDKKGRSTRASVRVEYQRRPTR